MSESFVLPQGIILAMTDDGLVIENEGDIVLHGQIDGGIHALTSHNGDVILNNDFVLHQIDAPNGAVEIHGKIEADRIEAANVSTDGEHFTVRVVQASQSISIGETTAHVEVLIAPAVTLASSAVGRITVVESHNELGPSKVKGCLNLADLEELFDGSEGFIRGWEITPLHKSPSKKAAPKAKAKAVRKPKAPVKRAKIPAPEAEVVEEVVEFVEEVVEEVVEVVEETTATTAVVAEVEVDDEPEEIPTITMATSAPVNGETEDRAEQVEQLFDLFDEGDEDTANDPALDGRISAAVEELVSYYSDAELPPVVQRLAQLVAERDYKTVRDEVDDIWNKLLRYHKQKKLRPKPSLTTTFNTIHAIVREM
jgi:hypothetical protein